MSERNTSDEQARVERLAWIMDQAIRLPGGYRIGLDGLLGLVPGIGDALGLAASGYVIDYARRLGVPRRTLLRMGGNVLVDALVGVVPLVGDLFDFTWKANTRNIELIRRHQAKFEHRARETAARGGAD